MLLYHKMIYTTRCLWYLKDFYLKAIPNGSPVRASTEVMFVISQRLLFESNSQLGNVRWLLRSDVCDISKTFIWKQFPTERAVRLAVEEMFVISQRLLFESNSQQLLVLPADLGDVCDISKTFIWKQFPTQSVLALPGGEDVCDISKTFIWKQFPTCGRCRTPVRRDVCDISKTSNRR